MLCARGTCRVCGGDVPHGLAEAVLSIERIIEVASDDATGVASFA